MSETNQPITFRSSLDRMTPELEKLLPENVPVERFKRVALTAIMNDSQLPYADQKELFNSLLRCAQDGLYPDKREAAIVVYKGKPQYLPMIGGILKRLRNSRELKSITVEIVRKNDKFRYWVDENGPHVEFEPSVFGDRGPKIGVFCVVYMLSGGVYVEVMNHEQLQKIRNLSQAKKGPWFDFEEEMEKKTVLRRVSKYLPLSSELVDMMATDDEFIEVDQVAKPEVKTIADVEKEAEKCESLPEKPAELSLNTEPSPLPPEPAKPEVPKISRKEMGKEILKMSGELGWSAEALAIWVQKEFKKTTKDLTDEEMFDCGNYLAELRYGKGDK